MIEVEKTKSERVLAVGEGSRCIRSQGRCPEITSDYCGPRSRSSALVDKQSDVGTIGGLPQLWWKGEGRGLGHRHRPLSPVAHHKERYTGLSSWGSEVLWSCTNNVGCGSSALLFGSLTFSYRTSTCYAKKSFQRWRVAMWGLVEYQARFG